LPGLAQGFTRVLIDGPPRVYNVARSAIGASDLVLIPVQPSPYDVWAAKEIIDLLNEAIEHKDNLKSAFVINRKIVNTAIGRDVADALKEYPIPVLQSAICQRVAFAETASQGLTVFEIDAESPGCQEITSLAAEMDAFLL
jgi:chromosome partitioning protein